VTAVLFLGRGQQDLPEKWETIKSALEDNSKMLRLCLILLVMSIPATLFAVGTIIAVLITRR
jgi:hypothetical protein